MSSVDLSDEDEVGSLWLRIYFPDSSIITNVELRWGSSSSNYWSATATSPHDQSSFQNGWNVLRFDWNGATETGTVDPSAITYARITINYDGTAETDIRVDKLTVSLGEIYELEYYSNYMFQSSGGTWKEKASSDSDVINLDQLAYQIYVMETAKAVVQQVKTQQAKSDLAFLNEELYGDPRKQKMGLYDIYEEQHPSEAIKKQSFYWDSEVYEDDYDNR
jgi:hypothetical protein